MLFQFWAIYKTIYFFLNLTSISKIYELLLNVLCILNSDIRRDIFIGVTGLMVAIIIFIAEIISNKKYELEKRLILGKTEIIKNMKFCIFIYFMMFVSSLVECPSDLSDGLIQNILFIMLQLSLNILIIIFMYKTFNIFKISVRLNTNKEYFNKELDNYVNNRTIEIENDANSKSLKNINQLKQEFENYVQRNDKLFIDSLVTNFSEERYIPICVDKKGLIKSYNYKKIDAIIESIDNVPIDESKGYLSVNQPAFIFVKQIGDKVEKNSVLGYCLKGYKKYFEAFSNCIIYDENSMYISDEIKLINENLFQIANTYYEPEDFDSNNKLFNYFKYLYKNELNGVRRYAINQLEETARIVYKDKYKNYRYTIFLNRILSLSYNNDNFEEYRLINKLIFSLYYQQLQIDGIDIKDVAYNFANQYFKFGYFSIKNNDNISFYDDLMSNLLKFICILIIDKKFDAISVIFKNILLENNGYISDDFDKKDILNLQFAIGIIQCLVMLVDKNDILDEVKKGIINIINWTRRYFINTYDAWQIIINFKENYDKISSIQDVYKNLDFYFADHKYLSSWSIWQIDEKKILKELLCAFKIRFISKDNINFDEITKDDKYYFADLLQLFNSNKETKFEKELGLKFSNDNYTEVLKLVVEYAEKKDKEYIKNNRLNNNMVKDFERIIKATVFKTNELENYLLSLNKVETSDIMLKRVCGINQLIPRDIFFENCVGYESIAEQFGEVFVSAKEKEFIKSINSISTLSKDNVDEVINKLIKIEDYLLITNYINCETIKCYDMCNDAIIINNKELDILKIPQADAIYLIEKKQLPKLQYCDFDEDYDHKNIDKNLYYELNDCSVDETLRYKIIENSSWLSEKGRIAEQQEYLKQQCRLRLFLAFRFYKIKYSMALKFNVNDE